MIANSEIIFNEEQHSYIYKGAKLPSVTKIMEPLSSDIYKTIAPEILEVAARRGTLVHYATELLDLYGVEEIDEVNKGYLEAYKKFKEDFNPVVIEVEKQLVHPKFFYAGTLDRILEIDGKHVLVDIKTTSSIHRNMVSVQTSAYEEMARANSLQVDEKAVLQLKHDGTYEFIRDLPNEFDTFIALYKVYMFKKREEK